MLGSENEGLRTSTIPLSVWLAGLGSASKDGPWYLGRAAGVHEVWKERGSRVAELTKLPTVTREAAKIMAEKMNEIEKAAE